MIDRAEILDVATDLSLPHDIIRFEAEDAGRQPGVESLPSRRLGRRSRAGFLIC